MFECKTEKRNSQCKHGQPTEQTRSLFACAIHVLLSVNHNNSVTSGLANDIDDRSEMQGRVSLVAVNQILCRS